MVKDITSLGRVNEDTAVRVVLEWKPTCKRHPSGTPKQRRPDVIKENMSTRVEGKVEKNCDVGKNS